MKEQELSVFDYIRQTGITGLELVTLLGAAFFGWLLVLMVRERRRARHTPPTEPVAHPMGVVSMLGGVLVFGYFFCSLALRRYQADYQLRPEASRYVVGEVYGRSTLKAGPVYNYHYRAGGQLQEGSTRCDSNGCPPVGTHFFIHYALADPSFSRSTGEPVPDSLAALPGREWAELP